MDTISGCMAQDNQRAERWFKDACAQVRQACWPAACTAVARLAGTLEQHIKLEEDLVFCAFDAAARDPASPTAALRAEHKWIRGILVRLAEAASLRDASAFFKHAGSLSLVLQYHHQREAMVFYPMAERLLAPQRERLNSVLRAARHAAPAGLAA